MPATQHTTLSRRWLLKTIIFTGVLLVFGVWGLYDALIAYPNRGIAYAEYEQWKYLDAARDVGMLPRTSIADPAAELDRLAPNLKSNTAAAGDPSNPNQGRARMEVHLTNWLRALDTVGRLDPSHTAIADPRVELDRLANKWTTANQPKALAKWDIPVQWVFVVIGLGGGAWLLGLFVSVKRLRYGWDPAEQRLYLPDGSTLVPSDIAEFDKRKWDKFLIFLHIRPGHEPHGGKELRLDLYRYEPLERWILEMEKTAFPEETQPPAPEPVPGGGDSPEPALESRSHHQA